MPKLSIITINYNNKAGLEKTIQSVISQSWRDYEWIIIDGGSVDGSKELIESVASSVGSQITYWCSETDKGIYNAMNNGIAKAKGEYLNFMNSGDCYYSANTLEKVSPYLQGDDFVIGNAVKGDTDELWMRLPEKGESIQKYVLFNSLGCHQAGFVKRELNKKLPYDESLKIVSDWKFHLQAVNFHGAKVNFVDTIVARMEPDGISSSSFNIAVKEHDAVIKEIYGHEVLDLVQSYNGLRYNEILVRTNELIKNDITLYRVVRRFLSLIIRIYKFKHKIIS